MKSLGDRGTTLDGGTEQTRELMPATEGNVVPMPLVNEGVDGTRSPSALSDERKAEIEKQSKLRMELMQQEYWRLRSDIQSFMKCPYCERLNFVDENFCCALFTKAFAAIIERQQEVDVAASHVRNCHKVGLVH